MKELSELRVCLDIGSHNHRVAIGLDNGTLLKEFDIAHTTEGIQKFFSCVEQEKNKYNLPVVVAMESFNGHARPIDQYVLNRGYRLFSINNHKLSRFKEIFPGAAKTDAIDARKMLELLTLKSNLPLAKDVVQEVKDIPLENQKLKRLSRRRKILVFEKTQLINRLNSELNAVAPGLTSITKSIDNKWFLSFLTARKNFKQLITIHKSSLIKLPFLGLKNITEILNWRKTAKLAPEIDYVGDMVIRDAKRIKELKKEISQLEEQMEKLSEKSFIACRLKSIPGFGKVSIGTLAGEIGTLDRFKKEASLALYLGMAPLDNSSGKYFGSKSSKHVNKNAKNALMIAVARHIELAPVAKEYYLRKRQEGKRHNQAVRACGRHLIRIIYSMLIQNREYQFLEGKA